MLLTLILNIFFKKEVPTMAVIYATLIIKGKKTINDVPVILKGQVVQILKDLEIPELAEAE